jgi:hypothetical protein
MLAHVRLVSGRALCLQYLTYAFENKMNEPFALVALTSCIG